MLTDNEMRHIEIFTKKSSIRLEMDWMPGFCSALPTIQLTHLDELCESINAKTFVDIGCFIGGFTKIMARHAKEKNGKVLSVDLFKKNKDWVLSDIHNNYEVEKIFRKHMQMRELSDCIYLMNTDSVSASYHIPYESVDLVFIDANHSYKSVLADLNAWYPKVKKGGIICGHDYEYSDYDEQYIDLDGNGDRHHGVIKAVNVFFEGKEFSKGTPLNCIWSHKKGK